MKIADERSDAIELIADIKKEMAALRNLLSQLEYLVYEKDDRCEIRFLDGEIRKHNTDYWKS